MSDTEIKTRHYRLDDLRLGHAGQLFAIAAHPNFFYPYIHGNICSKAMSLRQSVESYVQLAEDARKQVPQKTFVKGVFDKNRDDLLGVTVLVEIGRDDPLFAGADTERHREIGFFTDASMHNKGIATEASQTLIAWAKQAIGLTGLWASVDPGNGASIAVLKKLGMEKVKDLPDSHYTDRRGQIRPRSIYRVTF